MLRLTEVERPAPKEDEILVKIHATAVTRADVETRAANRRSGPLVSALSRLVSGVRRPRQPILGSEFAGEVEAVGAAVNEFAVGDQVFGSTGFRFGAYAEYICVRQSSRVAHMAKGMSFEEGAAICDGGLNALWCLRQADIQKGQRYLIYGASGAIGTAAVQLAKHFGTDVTAVCSTKNLDLMGSLGADRAIDYTKEDFTRNGERYDVILDAVGKHSFKRCKESLKAGGKYLATDRRPGTSSCKSPAARSRRRVASSPPPASCWLHQADDVTLRVREQRDRRLRRDLGQRHEHPAAKRLDLGEGGLRVAGVDVERHSAGRSLRCVPDAAGDGLAFAAQHAVTAGVAGVELPAENILVELLELRPVLAGDFDVNDRISHDPTSNEPT